MDVFLVSSMFGENLFLQLHLLLVALIANFFSALAGGGAGLVQLPALILLGLPFHIALATHKIASVALGIGATYRYLKAYSLDKRLICLILFCGLPGVCLGARFVLFMSEDTLNLVLGILTISLAIYSSVNREVGLVNKVRKLTALELLIGGLIFFCIGFLNGAVSSGSGLFVTISLVYYFGLDYSRAVAYTLIFVGLFWNATGAIALGIDANIAWSWLPSLFIGSLLGGYLGSHVAILKGNQVVKKAFEIIALAIGISLLFKSLNLN